MRLMPPPDFLDMLHADNVADNSGVQKLFKFAGVAGVTQNMAYSKNDPVFLCGGNYSFAFRGRRGHRLFQHDMIAFFRKLYRRFRVHIVLGCDNYAVRELFPFCHILPVRVYILFRNVEFPDQFIAIKISWLGDSDDFKTVRKGFGKFRVTSSAGTGPCDDQFYLFHKSEYLFYFYEDCLRIRSHSIVSEFTGLSSSITCIRIFTARSPSSNSFNDTDERAGVK